MPDEIPAPMSLSEAVAVLNRVGHRDQCAWTIQRYSSTCVVGNDPCEGDSYELMVAVAIAEYYLRRGIEPWPGWERGG